MRKITAWAHFICGNLLSKLERVSWAEREYRRAIEINHKHATAYLNLGLLLCDIYRYAEARDALGTAVSLFEEKNNTEGAKIAREKLEDIRKKEMT